MAYAVGDISGTGAERITRLDMKWKVSNEPSSRSNAFYSPWFGMDPADNLNLIQPVNPWLGGGWAMYTEYFQWQPVHNSNSDQHGVEARPPRQLGLHARLGCLSAQPDNPRTGVSSHQMVSSRVGKVHGSYVVYEKTSVQRLPRRR